MVEEDKIEGVEGGQESRWRRTRWQMEEEVEKDRTRQEVEEEDKKAGVGGQGKRCRRTRYKVEEENKGDVEDNDNEVEAVEDDPATHSFHTQVSQHYTSPPVLWR